MDTSPQCDIVSLSQFKTDATLKLDNAFPSLVQADSSQQFCTVTSAAANATTSAVTVTAPNENDSIGNTTERHGLFDEPIEQNALPSKNCSPIIKSVQIADNCKLANKKCEIQPENSSLKCEKNLKDLKKKEHTQKDEKREKNKLKETERKLKEKERKLKETERKLKETERTLVKALESVESYRKVYIKKQQELEKWQNLNAQLQSKIYEKIDEYADRNINPFEHFAKGEADVGYLRKSDNMIHCGNNIFISKTEYDNAKNKLYAYNKTNRKGSKFSGFVRYIAEVIFGYETLKKSSVTGKKSRRTKSEAKEKLDPTMLGAVIGIFRHYLAVDMQLDPVQVAQEVKATGEHIASKIADMNRKSKKNKELEELDGEEEVEAMLLMNEANLNNLPENNNEGDQNSRDSEDKDKEDDKDKDDDKDDSNKDDEEEDDSNEEGDDSNEEEDDSNKDDDEGSGIENSESASYDEK